MADKEKKNSDAAFIISAEDLIANSKLRPIISTGILSADIALGGGIPLGCTVLIGGPEKMGKTTLVLQTAANAQSQYGCHIFYFPLEGRLTQKVLQQVRNIKLDGDHFSVVMPPPIKDDGVIVGYQKWPAERWWDEIGEVIKTHTNAIIILDSIANLSTEKEFSEDMGWSGRGDKNKLEAQFCRKFGDMIIPNKITVFIMTQMQANTSGYGAPIQLKVGNQIKFQADVIIRGKGIEKWDEQDGRILGQDCVYIIQESALGPPHIEAKIPLRYGWGLDYIKDTVTQALNWGILSKGGAWFELPFVEEDGKFVFTEIVSNPDKDAKKKDKTGPKYVKLQGENAVRNWFLLNEKEFKIIEGMLRKQILG